MYYIVCVRLFGVTLFGATLLGTTLIGATLFGAIFVFTTLLGDIFWCYIAWC